MKALFFDGKLELREVPIPERKAEEALVKVIKAGICNTDQEIMKGYLRFFGILGHEFVGRVEETDHPDRKGKRVVGEINVGCGRCEWCQRDMARHCPHRTVLGILNRPGAFAEYLTLPESNLLAVPESVPDNRAVFTEPLAAALEIQEQINIEPDFSICVIGDGKLGLLIAWTLALVGPDITLVGRHPERASLLENKGIRFVEANEKIERKFDIVVEASGSPSGWETAVGLTRPRGTLILKSTYAEAVKTSLAPLVIDEITVVGSRCGRFAPALDLLENERIDPTPLITAEYGLDDYRAAFSRAREKDSLKVILRMM